MRIETYNKFLCDVVKCPTEIVLSTQDGATGAYIDLTLAGWRTHRGYNGWKHYCPEHALGDDGNPRKPK